MNAAAHTAAHVLVQGLVDLGVELAFGVSGGGIAAALGQRDDQLAAIRGVALAGEVATGDQCVDELACGLLGDA